MAAKIKLLRSTVAGRVPATLESGQVAINEADGKLFWRGASGAVQSIDLTLSALTAAVASKADAAAVSTALTAKLNAAAYTAADVLAKLLTVDGSGSGLDADKLRGTVPSAFGLARLSDADAASAVAAHAAAGLAKADATNIVGRLSTDAVAIPHWDDARQSGWYSGNGVANAPATGWFMAQTLAHNWYWTVQTAYAFTDSANGFPVYRRHQVNGTWSAWERVPWRISTTAQAQAGTDDATIMTPAKVAQAIAVLAPVPTPGQPIPTSSADYRVGSVMICFNAGVSPSIANGSSTAGSNLRVASFSDTGPLSTGAPLSGTWKNITGSTITILHGGYFVRIA